MNDNLFDFSQFRDLVVAVTGGGKNGAVGGIGYHVAVAYAQGGARLALIGRTEAALERTASEIRDLGTEALIVAGDVARTGDLERFFRSIEERFGRLDILVNNAGISGDVRGLCRMVHERFRYAFNVHLHTQTATRLAADLMRRRGVRGTIVNVGTYFTSPHRQILRPYPYRTPYTGAQAWKLELSRLSAWELAVDGISVVALNPGPIEGGRIDEIVYPLGAMERGLWGRTLDAGDIRRKTEDMHPAGKFLTQDQVARSIIALSSQELRETANGAVLELSGGLDYRVSPRVSAPTPLRGIPDLSDRRILVTAHTADARIESLALGLAAAGARVVVAGPRAKDAVATLRGGVQKLGAGQRAIVGKVSAESLVLEDEASVAALFDRLLEDPQLRGVDGLIHVTGEMSLEVPFTSMNEETADALKERYAFVPALVAKYASATFLLEGARRAGVEDVRFHRLCSFVQLLERDRGQMETGTLVRQQEGWTQEEEALLQRASRVAQGSLTVIGPDFQTSNGGRVRRTEVMRVSLQSVFTSLATEMGIAGARIRSNIIFPGRDGESGEARRLNRLVLFLVSEQARKVSGMVYCPDELNAGEIPSQELEGKVAVVSGGGHHSGQQVSLRLAREGARVVLVGPDVADLEATKRAIEALGGEAVVVAADPTQPLSLRDASRTAREVCRGIDVWVNTAGAGGAFATLGEIDLAPDGSWQRTLSINFRSAWHGLVRAIADMRRRSAGGSLVNLSSYYANRPVALRSEYTVSKMLLHSCAALLAEPLRPMGISITDLQPSLTEASNLDRVRRDFLREFERNGIPQPGSNRAVRTWLKYTIPEVPPRLRDVAEAVFFAARHGMQQSGSSIRISTLPGQPGRPVRTRPPLRNLSGDLLSGRNVIITSTARSSLDFERVATLVSVLKQAGTSTITVAADEMALRRLARRGVGDKARPAVCDISDPARIADLFGQLPRPDAVVHLAGSPAAAERFLDFPTSQVLPLLEGDAFEDAMDSHLESLERFLSRHVGAALAVSRAALRHLRPDGRLFHVGSVSSAPEATLLNRALEQIVRVARIEWLLFGSGARSALVDAAGVSPSRLAERVAVSLSLAAPVSRSRRSTRTPETGRRQIAGAGTDPRSSIASA